MTDIIIAAIIVVIVGLAGFYVYRTKKSGKKCVGCPNGCTCGKSKESSCSCCHTDEENK